MNFRIKKGDFLRGLRLAQSISNKKGTMPMLANVLLKTEGADKLLVVATDLAVSISAVLPSENFTDGGLTVGAKELHDIVANMPGEDLTVQEDKNHWAQINAGRVRYRLVGMGARDYPRIPSPGDAVFGSIDGTIFSEMLDKTAFAMSNDQTRFHLNGVLFECNQGKAAMASTDGHRLSLVKRELAGSPDTTGVIIPKKGISEIKRTLGLGGGACSIALDKNYLFLKTEDMTLAVKLTDASFPPYQQVIPTKNENKVVIPRSLLMDALKRATLVFSTKKGTTATVKFTALSGALKLSTNNTEIGEINEEMDAVYDGDEVSIGFNPKYVMEFLGQSTGDQVCIELGSDALQPGILRPVADDDYLAVVMPMRLN